MACHSPFGAYCGYRSPGVLSRATAPVGKEARNGAHARRRTAAQIAEAHKAPRCSTTPEGLCVLVARHAECFAVGRDVLPASSYAVHVPFAFR